VKIHKTKHTSYYKETHSTFISLATKGIHKSVSVCVLCTSVLPPKHCMLHIYIQPITWKIKTKLSPKTWATFGQFGLLENYRKQLKTSPNCCFFLSLPPNKPVVPSANSYAARIGVCCHGLSVVQVPNLISPLRQYANVAESLDVHCYRICQRWCTLPPSMHAAIRASSVYVKFWTVHLPDLSSALATNFIYIYIYIYWNESKKNLI